MENLCSKQSGLTLVELMIAMLIGLFLLQGVLYVFQSSKSGFRLIESEAAMHDSALFAIESLNSTIRMAGHNDFNNATLVFDPSETWQNIDTSGLGLGVVAGDIIQGADPAGAPDQIDVFFEGAADGSTRNCLGAGVAAGTVVRNTFTIDATNNELECGVNNAPGEPLVSNVTDMQVTWGIDNNADGEADQFVAYAALGTAAARQNIVALIITLRLSSGTGDSVIANKTFTTAVALRNKL